MTPDTELTRRLRDASEAEGFVRMGVAAAIRLDEEAAYLDAWLAEGRHGQMAWMERTAEVRKDPRDPNMLATAQTVVVLAAPYSHRRAFRGPPPARVARYAMGRDYHNVLTKRARRVARTLVDAGHVVRVAVDSKPVFERAWAERSGVGFVGKNCCLIVPGIGSHVFLACLVTSAPLESTPPIDRRCGSCTLCLDACPTRAFVEPRTLDARRCISYLTIEHRGEVADEHRAALGPWLFGCDVCQDVCPYNHAAGATPQSSDAFAPDARWDDVDVTSFLAMSDEEHRTWSEGSPLRRAGRENLARNAALVLGNCGNAVHLAVLDESRRGDPSAVVRDAATWGAERLRRRLADEG